MAKVYSGIDYIDAVLRDSQQSTTPVNSWSSATTVGQGVSLTYDWMTVAGGDIINSNTGNPFGGFQVFTADQENAAIAIMDMFAEVADITFTYDSTGTADIEYGTLDFGGSPAGYISGFALNSWTIIGNPATNTYYTHADVYLSNAAFTGNDDQTPGDRGFATMLHEIGHALGLAHTFDNVLPPAGTDSEQYSAMSYTSHPGMSVDPSTPLLYDVAAVQYLYGANMTTRTGNDNYTWATDEAVVMAIWDAGGIDTLSAVGQTRDSTINLNDGEFSSIGSNGSGGDALNNIAIAYGATIENATGGSGDDMLIGNDVANRLFGGSGDDTMDGGGGNDRINAAFGNDTVNGGSGRDTVDYSDLGSAASIDLRTTAPQTISAAGGIDSLVSIENVVGGKGGDLIYGTNGANRLDGFTGNDTIYGLSGNDTIIGGILNDTLRGNNGRDTLIGGNGRDSLGGGAGSDRFVFEDASDSVNGGFRDRIQDFESGTDFIDLSAIDAIDGGSDDAFTFITGGFTGAGQLRAVQIVPVNKTIIYGNTDSDTASEFQIEVTGLITLDATDFIL